MKFTKMYAKISMCTVYIIMSMGDLPNIMYTQCLRVQLLVEHCIHYLYTNMGVKLGMCNRSIIFDMIMWLTRVREIPHLCVSFLIQVIKHCMVCSEVCHMCNFVDKNTSQILYKRLVTIFLYSI